MEGKFSEPVKNPPIPNTNMNRFLFLLLTTENIIKIVKKIKKYHTQTHNAHSHHKN